jgi:cytochrome c biogenesis protein CcdA/thiol-disulfide isomerase/thioredoxin
VLNTLPEDLPVLLILLAYLGGVLTILSPCILPVLPFVFARADRPFLRSGLPLLAGMVVAFAGVATLAVVGGGWAVHANVWGRNAALVLLALFGLALLFPALAGWMTRPLVQLGARISARTGTEGGVGSSLLLGVATGLLWAPCAGPILGLILTGAAIRGANLSTTVLLLAYGLGAATSLACALLVGGRVLAMMKRSLGVGEWVRRTLGALVLAGVAVIALGLDTGFLTQVSLAQTTNLEQGLLNRAGLGQHAGPVQTADVALPDMGPMPSLSGATLWLNSKPLTRQDLRGKVVLIDFWTYSCINCLRALPYVKAWAAKYGPHGLVVIGVHTPEFAFEKDPANVKAAVKRLGVTYPVALDNNYAIWRAFKNNYWPAHYFIDAKGRIRHTHFGEGEYDQSEKVIQQLLKEAGRTGVPGTVADVAGQGVEAAPDLSALRSPETYIGYARAQGFAGGLMRPNVPVTYDTTYPLVLNRWGLEGTWTVGSEKAVANKAGGVIGFHFQARDLNLVMGSPKPVAFRVTIDGHAPGADHGVDTDAEGRGMVQEQRLYQLIRQHGAVGDHTFRITFDAPGVEAFAFTFG